MPNAIVVVSAIVTMVGRAPVGAADGALETLHATGGLPAHLVSQFTDPVAFVETTAGEFLVLDRRAHTVYSVDRAKTSVKKVIEIGAERGRVLQPAVLSLSKDDVFAVADAPAGIERIQYFGLSGSFLGGFYLQTKVEPRLVLGPLVLNGVGSMHFTGRTFLVNRPKAGALVTEYDTTGAVTRQFGTLRPTGQESNADVHIALNIGIPLAAPDGGTYLVFQTGAPAFRKYDARGTLVFERHIEGPELDPDVRDLPTTWRRSDETTFPLVTPLVRTAAVDPDGNLWISLMTPYTYVYDATGEKRRTLQFQGASTLAPASFFFTRDGHVLVTPGCYEFPTR
jgi:hypothetical protein